MGQCVGDEGLLDPDYTATPTHLFGASAKTPANLFFIRRDDLSSLFYSYPSVQTACRKAIALKMERWQRETEKVLKETLANDDDSAQPGVAAYTYQPRGELPLPLFIASTTRLASSDTKNVQDEGQATLSNGNGNGDTQEASGREPSNRELAAKIDALDAKINKIVDMMRHARVEHRK